MKKNIPVHAVFKRLRIAQIGVQSKAYYQLMQLRNATFLKHRMDGQIIIVGQKVTQEDLDYLNAMGNYNLIVNAE